jgi:hypothetical protein
MSSLWSPAGATGGNQSQTVNRQKPQKQAESVAIVLAPALSFDVHAASTSAVRR